jgi:uncharacterized protein (DUF779 family)
VGVTKVRLRKHGIYASGLVDTKTNQQVDVIVHQRGNCCDILSGITGNNTGFECFLAGRS